MKIKWTAAAAASILLVICFAFPVRATVRIWDGGAGDNYWTSSANWDPDGFDSSDDFIFDAAGYAEATSNVTANQGGSITLLGPASSVALRYDFTLGNYLGQGDLYVLNSAQLSTATATVPLVAVYVAHGVDSEGHAIVAGNGSLWYSKGVLYLGFGGTGTLMISDGGIVRSDDECHVNDFDVSVSGGGSTLSINHLTVARGKQGRLTVSNSGSVFSTYSHVGSDIGASGEVIISGAGASWINSNQLSVGHEGTGRLAVSNGGVVSNESHGLIGWGDTGQGAVTVSGAGASWSVVDGNLYLGGGAYDPSGGVWDLGGIGNGTLEISHGGSVSNSFGYIGYNPNASGNVLVQGDGASWSNSSSLYVGNEGAGTLTIQNGGAVSSIAGSIGRESTGTGGVFVRGNGSSWVNTGTIYVGREGTGILSIQNGGTVTNHAGQVGHLSSATGEVLVSGAGSVWNSSAYLYIGDSGTASLQITDGGTVSNNDGYIGYNPTASGNVVVSGLGSTWTNSSSLYVGRDGSADMTITAGGLVSNTVGYIARNNNSVADVLISGTGSTWNNSDNLYVGNFGTATLTIQNGGAVTSAEGHLGDSAAGVGDVSVIGSNSSWHNSGDLYVANSGHATLIITDGGSVTNRVGFVGRAMASLGDVTVNGADSTWNNTNYLAVGRDGTGTLQILDGGRVYNTIGYVGYLAGSSGDVTVSGAGSTWSNGGNLTVGRSGIGTLKIREGGEVTVDGLLRIAEQSTSTGTVNLEGGSLSVQSLTTGAGTAAFQWTGGMLAVPGTGGLTLDGGLLGPVIGIHANKGLNVGATTTVNSGVTLAVTGGEFITDTLTVSGTAQLRSGLITIGDTFAVNADGHLEITGQDLALLNVPTLAGELAIDQTTLSVPSLLVAGTASLNLDSGLISSAGVLDNEGVIRMGTTGSATIRALQLRNDGAVLGRGVFHAELSNRGNVGMSGDSSFAGDVTNLLDARIIISGGAQATFFEDVDNQSGAEIRVSQGCTATYFGRITGDGDFTGTGTSYIEGDLRPGASPGIMAFGGDVVFGALSSAEFELAGVIPGSEHDQLNVASMVSLAGTLRMQPLSPYTDPTGPGTVDAFAIITAADVEGTFDAILYNGVLLPDTFVTATTFRSYQGEGLFRIVEYESQDVVFSNYRAVPGDANGDLVVDGLDFYIWNTNKFTMGTDWTTGDFNGDGQTDGSDFNIWNAHKFTSATAASAVAEPTWLPWLVVVMTSLVAFRSRRVCA